MTDYVKTHKDGKWIAAWFYNEEEKWVWEPGAFDLMVGLDSEHVERERIFIPAGTGEQEAL